MAYIKNEKAKYEEESIDQNWKDILIELVTWLLELLDLYKDFVFMYFSYHHPYVIIPLIIFQINPFAMAHQYLRSERISHGYLHSFMMYLGLWDTELE